MTRNIGFILLAVYLILVAMSVFLPTVMIPATVHGLVALVAAVFILLGR